jgi:hypothetical protein
VWQVAGRKKEAEGLEGLMLNELYVWAWFYYCPLSLSERVRVMEKVG